MADKADTAAASGKGHVGQDAEKDDRKGSRDSAHSEVGHYVIVRHREDVIKDFLKADKDDDNKTGEGKILEKRDTLSDGGVVAILEFDEHSAAVKFTTDHSERFFGTVISKLDDARRLATAKAEGQ